MLISFLALLKFIDTGLVAFSSWAIGTPWTLGTIFAYLFSPFGYLLGFEGADIFIAGQLLGTKVAVNELFAFSDMVKLQVSDRMMSIMTYALCGFSNFSCIGIQVGGIGVLVPEKRGWLTELGLYAVLGGALTNLLTAMVANIIL
jgi:CNT family concentrative nucleoside transporter